MFRTRVPFFSPLNFYKDSLATQSASNIEETPSGFIYYFGVSVHKIGATSQFSICNRLPNWMYEADSEGDSNHSKFEGGRKKNLHPWDKVFEKGTDTTDSIYHPSINQSVWE